MFRIIILYITLDIQNGFFGYLFGFFGFFGFSGSVNNTSSSDIFCTTLQDPFGYFFIFRTKYESDFLVRV